MLCLIAKNSLDAERWARSQELDDNEWFCPRTTVELLTKKNFHVIVVSFDFHSGWFEKFYKLAKERGKIR